jgi:predicted metalloprotease with PDZ domain
MTDIVGVHPCKSYLFIIHHVEEGGGGLEHANSNVVQFPRFNYTNDLKYKAFLGLCAHEYFHLWNVKRIRPKELGPFDYENEAYTSLLWVMEGFTSYYDELILLRAGFYSPEQYLNVLSGTVTSVENQPGNKVLPLSEASLDAWIKLYRPNENSYNTTISYYSKGACVAAMLDAFIIASTDGNKGLDDVLVLLYKEYYEKQNRGFTENEIKLALEKVSGKKLDDFFANYINGTEPIPYEDFVKPLGLNLKQYIAAPDKAHLGIRMGGASGKTTISTVIRNTSSFDGGLNVNDEIVAINGYRMNDQAAINNQIKTLKVGDQADFLIVRDGQIRSITVTMKPDPSQDYAIGGRYNKLGQRWLKKDFGG